MENMEKLIGLYNYMNHSSKSELAEMYNEDKFYFVVSNLFEIKGYPELEEDSFATQEEFDEYENDNNIDMLKEIVDMYYDLQYSIDILHNMIGEAHYIYDQSQKVSSSSSSSGSYDSSNDSFGGFSGGGGGGTR
ncbi:MAG: hypothetical protein LUG46_06180 [Erysipelotrichaceae bacterium]|nr:hypothetical protein [Erysipelotrichaceae bacterium]